MKVVVQSVINKMIRRKWEGHNKNQSLFCHNKGKWEVGYFLLAQ